MATEEKVRSKNHPGREVQLIDVTKLDLTYQEWNARFEKTKLTTHQFAALTDMSRPRLKRIREGDPKSLVVRAHGVHYVPRVYTIALIAIEMGLLTVGEDSTL